MKENVPEAPPRDNLALISGVDCLVDNNDFRYNFVDFVSFI